MAIIHHITGPMGAVPQKTLDEHGNEATKYRMTHDQSFDYGLEDIKSVNQRVLAASLTKCVYGNTLQRLVHAIIMLRWKYPFVAILIGKLDYKSAFRRLHLRALAALRSVITTKGLMEHPVALASLRVTFGGRPSPFSFSELSESVTDLANVLARCPSWDPRELRPTHSTLVGQPKLEEESIPFAQARKLLITPNTDKFGLIDVFLDDIISVFPAISGDHVDRCSLAALLAMEVTSRPNLKFESLPREEMLALEKAIAEATPAERAIVLGWLLDTRNLLLRLPDDKHTNWRADTASVLARAKKNYFISYAIMSSLLGRLQHTTLALQEGCHFLNRIRVAEMRAEQRGSSRLNAETQKDLQLWQTFLDKAHRGIDMNLLVTREPNYIIRTDACEHGLGGFSLTTGRAWRYEIPRRDRNQKSINFLEFLACITGIIVSLYEGEGEAGDCFLCLGDNTSSLGWLRKSNFAADDEQGSHSALARAFALQIAEHGVCHFSKWFPGKENEVADVLSRDHEKSDKNLTSYIKFIFAPQVSETFNISPLPPEIISWLDYWVHHTPESTLLPPPLTKRSANNGPTGSPSWTGANCTGTPTSTRTASPTSKNYLAHSCTPSAKSRIPKVQRDMLSWLQAHAAPPSTVYERPSAERVDPIHRLTQMERLQSFYTTNYAVTPTKTHPPHSRNRSHSN